MATPPIVTIAVPSYNQGRFLQDALTSIFDQGLPVEVFVADAGSTDGSLDVIEAFETGWLAGATYPDRGRPRPSTKVSPRNCYVGWLEATICWAAD
jgi:GT2 family glycosyltransferase